MKQRNVYSVGQINTYIRNMFAQDFMMNHVAVRGEVSDCKYHSSGHIYFTLKDETGVLKAIMFRTQAARGLPFRMKEGDRVVVIGAIRIYEENISFMRKKFPGRAQDFFIRNLWRQRRNWKKWACLRKSTSSRFHVLYPG